jgi:2-methylcitrate dehydratase PrpD
MTGASSNGQAIGAFIAGAGDRVAPPEVIDAARLCLADWMGVAIGAAAEPAGRIVRETIAPWSGTGSASVIFGGMAPSPFAALANGTLAHCLDFDDTYVDAVTHTSAPVWAATLALGEETGASEAAMLSAFITGFEVAARVGHGLGQGATARGWHSTGVFGRIGAAAACAALLGLDADRALHAVALAATQTSGLTASFGTMAKPFHAGKAAMDGILSARLASGGFSGATGLVEAGGGLDNAVIQDGSLSITPVVFPVGIGDWRILRNSFKPYAACHLIHPAIDAARALLDRTAPATISAIRADIGPLALKITGQGDGRPDTALAGKFDLRYCVALALHGRTVSAADFREPWSLEPAIAETASKVDVRHHPDMGFASAGLAIDTAGGTITAHIPVAKGHPGNPMSWDDMDRKFDGLVAPSLHNRTGLMLDLLRGFGQGNALAEVRGLITGLPPA